MIMESSAFQNISFQNNSSFLSPGVKHIICELGITDMSTNVLNGQKLLDFHKLTSLLNLPDDTSIIHYPELVSKLAPCMSYVSSIYEKIPATEFRASFGNYLEWTGNKEMFFHIYEMIQVSLCEVSKILAYSLLTASIERALVNAYMLKNNNIPYLLKDLLQSNELEESFGKVEMVIMSVFLGSPSSLNLRNILWHGFVSPSEIDKRYAYFLIALTSSFGEKLCCTGVLWEDLPCRPYVSFENSSCFEKVFPSLEEEQLIQLEKVFQNSSLVFDKSKLYWTAVLDNFRKNRFGESISLATQQLENYLRIIYATVNNCAQRMLTAEATARYVTLSEILSENLDDGSKNMFSDVINSNEMEMLYDLFVHPEGPRLRDRLSHGEADFFNIPKYLVQHVLFISALFCMKFLPKNQEIVDNEFLAKLKLASLSYQPFFHPSSLLKQKVLTYIECLKKFEFCPAYVPEVCDDKSDICNDLSISCIKIAATTCNFFKQWTSFSDGLHILQESIQNIRMLTVFRPKVEYEMITLLRSIVHHSNGTCANIQLTLNDYYKQWKNKILRSRQRTSYSYLLSSVPNLYSGLRIILLVVLCFMFTLNNLSLWSIEERKTTFIFLKSILKHAENLEVMTRTKMNKWIEAESNTSDFLSRTIKYFEFRNQICKCYNKP